MKITAINTYASLQTILAHSKDINAIFCPIFKRLRERLMKLLDSKFMIFTDFSLQDFEDMINARFSPKLIKKLNKLEIDFAKFDKCLGRMLLLTEMTIYHLLGMPADLCALWYNAHVDSLLKDRLNAIKARIKYQRKSGTASTFIGT